MIHYLHLIGEFWFCRVVRVVEWFSETLFIKNFLSGGGGRTMIVKSKRDGGEEEELGLGSVTFTRGLGRKRVLFSNSVRESLLQIPATESTTPVKRRRSITTNVCERSRLESLPQELLIQVVCGVDHEDLKSLNIVSKSIREASLIAKELHFSFTTPKKTRAVRNQLDFEDSSQQVEDVEPPNAPVRHRWTEAKRKEQLSNVSVALFT
ncbi:F-box protein SKIP27 [Hirschfeldia incana]|nr:F-box protein SKIP27 [Hirschfeldia incana]